MEGRDVSRLVISRSRYCRDDLIVDILELISGVRSLNKVERRTRLDREDREEDVWEISEASKDVRSWKGRYAVAWGGGAEPGAAEEEGEAC